MTGTIKTLNEDRGFGFIAADDGRDYFFLRSAVDAHAFDDLRKGDRVELEAEPVAPKGPRARRVTVGQVPAASTGATEGVA